MVESLQQAVTIRLLGRRWIGWLPALLFCGVLGASCGCSMERDFFNPNQDGPPAGDVTHITTCWEKRVCWAPDTVHNGQPVPVIAGRMFLSGEDDNQLKGDGTVTVELYDNSEPGGSSGKPPKYAWKIDKATLQRLARKDMLGWGYTLYLPLWDYHPDLDRVLLTVKYVHDKSAPVFDAGTAIALNKDTDLHSASKTVAGGFDMKETFNRLMAEKSSTGSIQQTSASVVGVGSPQVASPQSAARTVIPLPARGANGVVPPPAPPVQLEPVAATGTIMPVSAPAAGQPLSSDWHPVSADYAPAETQQAAPQPLANVSEYAAADTQPPARPQAVPQQMPNVGAYAPRDPSASPALPSNLPASAVPVTVMQPPAPTGGLRRMVIPGGGSGIQQQNIWPPPQ
jgi:hypothetical protein